MSQKGDFDWGEDVVPYYAWFDGQVEYTTADETIDPANGGRDQPDQGRPDDGTSADLAVQADGGAPGL